MDDNLKIIKEEVYNKCGLLMSGFEVEAESKEYNACRFELNGLNIICRNAKTTPKKVGQFVTFWKRHGNKSIEPINENDPVDFFIVIVRHENKLGQFIFPKTIMIEKGIISTAKKEGKRAFRVYSPRDVALNKQAENTQNWQTEYFFETNPESTIKLNAIKRLFVKRTK